LNKPRCPRCGHPSWINDFISDACHGPSYQIITDIDYLIHRYADPASEPSRRRRPVELMMLVEAKAGHEPLRRAQQDTLSVFASAIGEMARLCGFQTLNLRRHRAFIRYADKDVKFLGAHLLRHPYEAASDGPFYWNNREVSAADLRSVLRLDICPLALSRGKRRRLDAVRSHHADRRSAIPLLFDTD